MSYFEGDAVERRSETEKGRNKRKVLVKEKGRKRTRIRNKFEKGKVAFEKYGDRFKKGW